LRARYFLHLLRLFLRQHPGRAFLAFVVLLVASAMMLLLADVGAALRFRVGAQLERVFPDERLRLEAGRAALGPIAIESKTITPAVVAELRRRPDVMEVLPIEPARVPVCVTGSLFGQDLASDAVIHGVPRALVADALGPGVEWRMPSSPDEACPLVASRYFLDLYNLGLARSSGLPLLNPDYVIGKHLQIVWGRSSVMPAPASMQAGSMRAEIVGLSSDPALVGLAIPDDAVRSINKQYGNLAEPSYVELVVRLRSGKDAERFLADVTGMGLVLSSGEMLGRQVKFAVGLAGWVLIGLALAVFALGMMTFYLLFAMIFHARRPDLARLRAMGMGAAPLLGLAVGEVGVMALAAVLAAGVMNYAVMTQANALALKWLNGQSWLPPNVLAPSVGWLALTSLVILAATLAASAPMLRWVFRVDLGQALRDS
jgi:hypothetical protein